LCPAFAWHPPAHEWANTQATLNAIERAKALRGDLVEKHRAAIEIVTAKHEAEKAARRA
jgi:hypothetical protein